MVEDDFVLFEDGTKISRAFISAMYLRLAEEKGALSYKSLLEENPQNVWVLPLLIESDASLRSKIRLDGSDQDELEALSKLEEKVDRGL